MKKSPLVAVVPVLLTTLLLHDGGDALARAPERGHLAGEALRSAAAPVAVTEAQASKAYHVRREDVLRAPNPSQGFLTEFTRTGVHTAARDGGLRFSMTTARYGCGATRHEVKRVEPEASENRVVYDHADSGLVEWYVNGPSGLEQGFTLPSAPPCNGAGGREQVIELVFGGELSATLTDSGASVDLREPSGAVVLRYKDLEVRDAAGRALPAHLELEEQGISIHLDDTDATYPLTVDPTLQAEETKLDVPGAMPGDRVGCSIAIDGDTALVGACHTAGPMGELDMGAAYVFTRVGQMWSQSAMLLPTERKEHDRFGFSVALSGNRALIGSWSNVIPFRGTAHVFVKNGAEWSQEAQLDPSVMLAYDQFGGAVALDGDTALVGAAKGDGVAWFFTRKEDQWIEDKSLAPSDVGSNKEMGWSAALSGTTAVVGAPGSKTAGAAYVFEKGAGGWSETRKLLLAGGITGDNFGISVAISGKTILVGAKNVNELRGGAYIFEKGNNGWPVHPQWKLLGSEKDDNLGWSVALDGDTAAIGVPQPVSEVGLGAVYIVKKKAGAWSLPEDLSIGPFAPLPGSRFGHSVAIQGNTVLVGAPLGVAVTGTAYAFLLQKALGSSCAMNSECPKMFCVDGVCCDTECKGECQACSKEKNAKGLDGFCGGIKDGADVDSACSGDYGAACKKRVCVKGACEDDWRVNGQPCGEDMTLVCMNGDCPSLPAPDAGSGAGGGTDSGGGAGSGAGGGLTRWPLRAPTRR